MKSNDILIIMIITIILIFILFSLLWIKNKKKPEGYITPFEDVDKYKIFKEYLTISDLNRLQLANKENQNLVLSLINRLFGYNSFSDLRNLKIFSPVLIPTIGFNEDIAKQFLDLTFNIFSILQPRVLKKSYTFRRSDNLSLNNYILVDDSNLNVEEEQIPWDLEIQDILDFNQDLSVRLITGNLIGDDKFLMGIQIFIKNDKEDEKRLILSNLVQEINNIDEARMELNEFGTLFSFRTLVKMMNRNQINNFNLNVFIKEENEE